MNSCDEVRKYLCFRLYIVIVKNEFVLENIYQFIEELIAFVGHNYNSSNRGQYYTCPLYIFDIYDQTSGSIIK